MAYEVILKKVDPERFAGVRGTYRIADLSEVMGREFGRVMAAMAAQGLRPAGEALTIYHNWTEDTVAAEMAFTIGGEIVPQGDVKPGMLRGGEVAFTVHVGPYDQLEAAYEAIQHHAQVHDLTLAGMMWERYLTDFAIEPDLAKHVTEVFWPLADRLAALTS